MKEHVLLVDDEKHVLAAMKRNLRRSSHDWNISCAVNADEAWKIICSNPCDAVVTDVCMPGPSGLELLEQITRSEVTRDLPVAVITGLDDRDLTRRALQMGASELLRKPVRSDHLVGRLENMLRNKAVLDDLRAANERLEREVELRTTALQHSRLSAICRLAMLAELRDRCTGLHVMRVAHAARAVAEALGLSQTLQDHLLLAAPLHDIGKIAIPDRILLKPGPLSEGEFAVMKRHCEYGEMILRRSTERATLFFSGNARVLDTIDDPVLDMAATIALTHHENFDGSGYPLGLSGEVIPLVSRIVTVCDVYDALTSTRPYRAALSSDKALTSMERMALRKFDSKVFEAFLGALAKTNATKQQFNMENAVGDLGQESIQ